MQIEQRSRCARNPPRARLHLREAATPRTHKAKTRLKGGSAYRRSRETRSLADTSFPKSPLNASPIACHGRTVPWQAASGRVALQPRRHPLFAIIAVPFDAFQALPRPEHRWLLTCFSRYVDRAGAAFPSLRQLAARRPHVAGERLPAAWPRWRSSRCSSAQRKARRALRLRPGRSLSAALARRAAACFRAETGCFTGRNTKTSRATKQRKARERASDSLERMSASARCPTSAPSGRRGCGLAQSRFWLPLWGPKPTEPGCFAPPSLMT